MSLWLSVRDWLCVCLIRNLFYRLGTSFWFPFSLFTFAFLPFAFFLSLSLFPTITFSFNIAPFVRCFSAAHTNDCDVPLGIQKSMEVFLEIIVVIDVIKLVMGYSAASNKMIPYELFWKVILYVSFRKIQSKWIQSQNWIKMDSVPKLNENDRPGHFTNQAKTKFKWFCSFGTSFM